MKPMQWFPVVESGAIPKNEGRRVRFGEHDIALFNLGTEYRAIDNLCPHKQGPLSDGIVSGKNVFCPLHSLKVNLEDGCTSGSSCVRVYPTKEIEGKIFIAFHDSTMNEPTHLDSEPVMDERI